MLDTSLVKHEGFDLDRCLAEVELAERLGRAGHVPPTPEHHALVGADMALAAARPSMPLGAACLRNYHAVHSSGTRPTSDIIWLVWHDEEALTALAAASWFQNPASGGSAHICSDQRSCYRTLADNAVAWGAPGANGHGLHFEQAGYAHWSRSEWLTTGYKTIERNAYKTAFHAEKYHVPIRLLTPAQLRSGYKGIVTHARVTKAFGGTHTDPGTGYPLDVAMELTREFRRGM